MGKQTEGESKKRPLSRLVKRGLLVVCLLVIVAGAAIFYLAKSPPRYYAEYQRFLKTTSPERVQRLSSDVDERLEALADLGVEQAKENAAREGSEIDDVRPEDVHINANKTLTLTNEQLAAMVQTHLDDWMKSRGYNMPQEVVEPMVAVDEGQLVMAFTLQSGPTSFVVSGQFSLQFMNNGYATLHLDRFLVGKLPVPAQSLSHHLYNATGDPRLEQVGEWLSKLQDLELKPVLELENRRRARVMNYHIRDDELELTLRIQDYKTYKATNAALASVPTP